MIVSNSNRQYPAHRELGSCETAHQFFNSLSTDSKSSLLSNLFLALAENVFELKANAIIESSGFLASSHQIMSIEAYLRSADETSASQIREDQWPCLLKTIKKISKTAPTLIGEALLSQIYFRFNHQFFLENRNESTMKVSKESIKHVLQEKYLFLRLNGFEQRLYEAIYGQRLQELLHDLGGELSPQNDFESSLDDSLSEDGSFISEDGGYSSDCTFSLSNMSEDSDGFISSSEFSS